MSMMAAQRGIAPVANSQEEFDKQLFFCMVAIEFAGPDELHSKHALPTYWRPLGRGRNRASLYAGRQPPHIGVHCRTGRLGVASLHAQGSAGLNGRVDWIYLLLPSLAMQTREGHTGKGTPAQTKAEDVMHGRDTFFNTLTGIKSFKHQNSLTPCTWTHAFWPVGVDPKMRTMGT